MSEHLEERVSERLANALNQPSQRGFLPGCHKRGTQGVGKNGYNVKTLMGNWYEEQSDTAFSSRRPLLLSDQERKEALTRTSVTASAAEQGRTAKETILRKECTFKAPQPEMYDVVDKRHTIFPGHQPQVDLNIKNHTFDQYNTDYSTSFGPEQTKQGPKPIGRALGPQGREEKVIHQVRERILERSMSGYRGIKRALKLMDSNGNNQLSPEELWEGLCTYGIKLGKAELDVVFRHFDRDGSGQISITEFVRGIRRPLNDRRLKLVKAAYKMLDKNYDGQVTMEDIKMAYDASHHPNVISGERTEEEVLKEFITSWDTDGDSYITLSEFVDYYTDISAGIDNEQYFELMIRNAWHISGGQGAAANTSCRRVLVIHNNGRQSVEEIKNDLGIGPNDIDRMIQNLNEQGITDIARIELTSGA